MEHLLGAFDSFHSSGKTSNTSSASPIAWKHSSNVYTHNFKFILLHITLPSSCLLPATLYSYRTHFDLLITASKPIIKLQRKEIASKRAIETKKKRCLFNCHFAWCAREKISWPLQHSPHLLTVIIGKRCVEGEIANNREFSPDGFFFVIITIHWSFAALTVPLAKFEFHSLIFFNSLYAPSRRTHRISKLIRVEVLAGHTQRRSSSHSKCAHSISLHKQRPFCPRLQLDTIDKPLTSSEPASFLCCFGRKKDTSVTEMKGTGRQGELKYMKIHWSRRLGNKRSAGDLTAKLIASSEVFGLSGVCGVEMGGWNEGEGRRVNEKFMETWLMWTRKKILLTKIANKRNLPKIHLTLGNNR